MQPRQDIEHLCLPHESFPHITSRSQRRAGHIFGHSPSPSTSSSSASSIISEDSFIIIQKPKTNLIANFFSPIIKRSQHTRKVSNPQTFVSGSKSSASLASALLHIQPLALSPVSPTFSIDFEKKQATLADVRLKKINKLAKTFGEDVPPELVFPQEHCVESPISKSASAGLRSLPKAPSAGVRSHTPASRSSSPTLAERRRGHRPRSLSLGAGSDMLAAKAAKFIIENETEPPRSNSTPPNKPLPHSKSYRNLALRAMTVKEKAVIDGYGLPKSPPPFETTLLAKSTESLDYDEATPKGRPQHGHSRQGSRSSTHLPLSSEDTMSNFSRPTHLAFTPLVPAEYGYRKEREWSGEWNVKDMHAIVKGLRDLKCR